MTPKEKAQEIFDKMYQVDDVMGNYPMCFDTAKKCAEIAVAEILANIDATILYHKESIALPLNKEYWNEVKTEIEKIKSCAS